MTLLDEILMRKRAEVDAARRRVAPADLAKQAEETREPTRGFQRALASGDGPRFIAELKRRSPSRGEIRPGFDPVTCARSYFDGGAAALSVLTDEFYFGGHLSYLRTVRDVMPLPLLRKDFVVDAYQLDEARVAGADAVLLIAGALPARELRTLRARAEALTLDVLVEAHDERELDLALGSGATLIGVNNRDLRTFEVDLGTTERLAKRIPQGVLLVAESGICTGADVRRLCVAGARAFLVGESLMRQPDPGIALRELREAS